MYINKPSDFWIKTGALTIELNYFDSPDYLQTSILAGAVVMAYCEGLIDYDASHNYRRWNLQAEDTFLNNTCAYYVYARLDKKADSKKALIVYDPKERAVDGRVVNGSGEDLNPSADYFYLRLGKISSSLNEAGESVLRRWEEPLQYGTLRTDAQVENAGNEKYILKKFFEKLARAVDAKNNPIPTNAEGYDIDALEMLIKLRTGSAEILDRLLMGPAGMQKALSDVALSTDSSQKKTDDQTIATSAWADKNLLSSQHDDVAAGFIRFLQGFSAEQLSTFLQGLNVGNAVDSMLNGKGTLLTPDGRIQTDRLEVRQSMKVMELIINRLQGMENDFVFSPTRKVLRVETIDATTYKLFLDPKMDGDLIPFRDGNIVYSIVNDLLTGGSNYYTSYSRVLSCNQNEYSITVSLYPDSEVPGGKNYIPVAGYNISRRGDVHLPTEGQSNPDAQSWYLSSSEGRLLFLQNVIKPVLEDYNYALSIGKIPRIQAVEDINLPQDAVGVMAETIVAQHIYQYDYNGDVVPSIVDRGQWSLAVAQSADRPYRNITAQTQRPSGTKYTLLEQHAAWRWGCKWGCLKDKTTEEPKWNAQDWALLEGDNTYYLDFGSSEGWQFFRGRVNTIITATITHGNEDITDRLISAPGTEVVWLRDSGNVPSDNTWKPTFANNHPTKLQLTNDDMPSEWGFSIRKVKFVCKVYIPDGAEPIVMNEFGFQI